VIQFFFVFGECGNITAQALCEVADLSRFLRYGTYSVLRYRADNAFLIGMDFGSTSIFFMF